MKRTSTTRVRRGSTAWLIVLSYVAFVSLGLPDGLLGVAWPRMRDGFGQPLDVLGVLLVVTTAGYMVSSFLNGAITRLMGVGGLLAASSVATAVALFGYTAVPVWWMVVALGFLAGLGAGAIDAGLNSYVEANFSAGMMQWLHASFGVGVTLGPLIMTWGLSNLDSWRFGYVIVAGAQGVLALGFLISAPLWNRGNHITSSEIHAPHAEIDEKLSSEQPATFAKTLQNARSWLSAMLFFIYTGIELSLGYWTYTLLTESRGIPEEIAGIWAGSYWATFTVGRILAGLYASRIDPARIVRYSLGAAAVGAALVWTNVTPVMSLSGIALVGFAIAPIFPAMVTTTYRRVGKQHTANTIGMQMAFAGLGVAVLPSVAGVLARRFTIEIVPPYLLGLIVVLLGLFWLATAAGSRRST